MNQQIQFPFKVKRSTSAFSQPAVTIRAPWRYMPYVLDNLRSETYDIQKAIVSSQSSTLYVRDMEDPLVSPERVKYIKDVLGRGITIDERERAKYVHQNQIILPTDTMVHVYNIPNVHCTVLEFICEDRPGLLCDMLDLLSSLPVEIHSSYITCVSNMAHNIFHIQRDNRALNDDEIAYVTNVFEYEVKRKDVMGDSSE